MGTFAHEFGHISGIGDNYNNPYETYNVNGTTQNYRTYAGNWELMSAGNQNGPGGTHARYGIPARAGDCIPGEHSVRCKIKQGFYDDGQYLSVDQESLVENGPAFATVVARNVPTVGAYGTGYGYNALVVNLTEDKTPIIKKGAADYVWNNVGTHGSYTATNKYYGLGYYQFYAMETIQRTGYDSFMYDEGVLLTMNREVDNESAPWTWVIDAHPEDINLVNFTYPGAASHGPAEGDASDVMVTPGDNRQLVDAQFHAGTDEDVVSEYVDTWNDLHFYVLDKMYDENGVLSYRVAVRSEVQKAAKNYSDQMSVSVGDMTDPETGKVFGQEIKVTNNGTEPGLYRVTPSNDQDWPMMTSAEVIEVAPGQTVTIPLFTEVPQTVTEDNPYTVDVTSEVSGKSASTSGVISGLEEEPEPGFEYDEPTYEEETNTNSSLPELEEEALDEFPSAMDPQSWKTPDQMTWEDDYTPNPVIDWTTLELPDAMLIKGVVILVDYADKPFVMTQPVGSDPLGNPQIHVAEADLAQWWEDFLNKPQDFNHGASINEYWRENSYGKWKIEVEAFGPYHLEGMEWEYGIDDMNGAQGAKRNIESEAIQLFLADDSVDMTLADFDFGFVVHAGYDESGAWQEAGEMMFQTKEDVPASFGLSEEEKAAILAWGAKPLGTNEPVYVTEHWGPYTWTYQANDITWAKDLLEGANWAQTRYVPWTSYEVAKAVWSYTSSYTAKADDGSGLEPGTSWRISVQGESDGMATFAHEFGHIRSIGDNYNNPFGKPDGRSYTGGWEVMSRGSFAGPGGTHTRWEIPSVNGSSAPAPHTTRLKLKQEFYERDQYTRITEDYLIQNGPVFETIVAREVPTGSAIGSIGYGVNSLMIDLNSDNTPIITKNDPDYNWQTSTWGSYNERNPYYGKGYYQFYGMEVVQRVGYDSFSYDDGVLLTMNREIDNENAPFIWVIDSHPDDIGLIDFVRPNGEEAAVSLGDARQLADALFHAGTGEDVVSEYFDDYNNLHFYVLDKMYDDQGVLSYRVAVRSNEQINRRGYSDQMSVSLGNGVDPETGKIFGQEIKITNNGTQPGLYRVTPSNDQDWPMMLPANVVEVAPGATVTIPLYTQVPETVTEDNDYSVTVMSEVSRKSATVEGTIDGLVEEPEEPDYNDNNYTYDPDYTDNGTSTAPEFDGKDQKDFPDEMDPQSWKVPENMTWEDDYTKNPVIDWTNMDLPNAMLIKGVVILVDYTDLPFVMTKPLGSDPLGNPQVHVAEEDLAEWWENFLNVPQELNHWTSINEYWRENSYGKWKIEVEAFGPYHLAGMEWEYGIDSKNGSRTTKRNMESESIALFMADMKAKNTGIDLSDYDFGFIVHAGYDESGGWQEAGEMMFQTKEDVPASFGMTAEEKAAIRAYGEAGGDISWAEHLLNGDNWIVTRYVPWTSWVVGKSVWSHTSTYRGQGVDFDGLETGARWRISVQGESDGMATFAHEFGHIRSIADNYNNPYGIPDGRSYTGGWEIMSRGSFAGPGGTHTRWEIPSLNGSSAPAPHTTRLKLKQEFYEDDQYTRVHQQFLIDNGPVFETIVAREVPTGSAIGSIGYGVNSLMIDLGVDKTPIVTKDDPEYTWQTSTWGSMRNQEFADRGYYQFYSMEVVQRIGYDSFSADDGVLLLMNREIANENAPFIWVVDMHPDDINLVDFVRPNGEKAMVSLGDARQLADALMKAGKGEGVVSEYYDEYNKLHFYVLDKMYDDQGVLSYRVAVHSEEFDGKYSDKMSVSMGDASPAKAGKVGVQEVIITNNGGRTR
jgi:M6 family metalloprotease-like protein